MERINRAGKKEKEIGLFMSTKEKPYPYLKNSTIEKESIKLLNNFCKKSKNFKIWYFYP